MSHEGNQHGWGGPCEGCDPCSIHGEDCPQAFRPRVKPEDAIAAIRREIEKEPYLILGLKGGISKKRVIDIIDKQMENVR